MSFYIDNWIDKLFLKVKDVFNERILFVGIQGSYKRNEATSDSDIDLVIILDNLFIEDLRKYKKVVQSMPNYEKACGFISGKEEIINWPKWEIFQFYQDTKPIYGSLDDLIPKIERKDIIDGIKANAAAIYHQACHSYLYSKNRSENISILYKNSFFILQSLYYIENRRYISSRIELLNLLKPPHKDILGISNDRSVIDNNVDECYEKIIKWCSFLLKNISN